VQAEIIRINTDARPFALLVALISFPARLADRMVQGVRMMRLPDPEPSGSVEGMYFGRSWLPIEQRSTGVG
jgi:hypothetical protein